MCSQPVSQPAGGAAQFVGRSGRQRKQQWCRRRCFGLPVVLCNDFGALGSLLQNGVHIGPRHSVCGHRRPPGCLTVGRPRRICLRDKEIGVNLRHLIRQTGEVKILWNNATPQGEHRLYQPKSAGGRLGVPEIGLHGCKRAWALEAVNLGQTGVFDGVAGGSAGAVCLHHAHAARVHTRCNQRVPIGRDLRGSRRCRNVHGAAVLVCGRAAYHGQDPVTISLRIR